MKAEIRNLNVNCQTSQKLREVRENLELVAVSLKFSSLHELIRWLGSQQPTKVVDALRDLRINELQR